jgi:ATPases involved in chromosome partitioning
MDLLPSNIDLSAAEVQLVTEVGREQTLGRCIASGAGPLRLRAGGLPALARAAHHQCAGLRGRCGDPAGVRVLQPPRVALLIDTIEKVRERLNPKLEIVGILATMYDPRTLHAREVMSRVVEAFGDTVFDTVINRTVRFPETTVAGEPITVWAPKSDGAKAYRALAREVIAR